MFPNHLSIKKIGKGIIISLSASVPTCKNSENALSYVILDVTLWYILTITMCILPLIWFMSNVHLTSSLQTVSKTFSKFMNTHNIFFFFKVKHSNNEYKENILLLVEYLCLKPIWLSLISKNSSE
jgi:hypothetical protein